MVGVLSFYSICIIFNLGDIFRIINKPIIEDLGVNYFGDVHFTIDIDFIFVKELDDRFDDIILDIKIVVVHFLREVVAFDFATTFDHQLFRLLERNEIITFTMDYEKRTSDVSDSFVILEPKQQ